MENIKPFGVIKDGAAFELNITSQVCIKVNVKFNSVKNTSVTTILEFLSTGAAPLLIAESSLDGLLNTQIITGASLRLPVGKYRWTTRITVNPDGMFDGEGIVSSSKVTQIIDDLHQYGNLGQTGVSGTQRGFVLFSGSNPQTTDLAVSKIALQVDCTEIEPEEVITCRLKIKDINSVFEIISDKAIFIGFNRTPTDMPSKIYIPFISFLLRRGAVYKISPEIIYTGKSVVPFTIGIGS